jgi:diphosphomevalonate decarboxylase
VNDFPADCGLASSASSFAALTLCAYRALKELTSLNPEDYNDSHLMEEAPQMSELSRQGSGSSCRSFFGPWAIWDEEGARKADLPYGDLIHVAVIADQQRKEVSSSAAHLQVTTSALFAGRPERADQRLRDLIGSLQENDWPQCFEICWAEFWDMHALFETSRPSFGYMNAQSLRVLESVRQLWKKGDGPLCTMDAGPNVHLLFRQDQKALAAEYIQSLASSGMDGTQAGALNIYTSLR